MARSLARQVLTAGLLVYGASLASTSRGLAGTPQQAPDEDRTGTVYEIHRDVETSSKDSNGSTDRSTDRDTLMERVIERRTNGLELEYSLPNQPPGQDQPRNWQFPLRIFKPISGPPQILNKSELEKRIDGWLTKSKLPRTACGQWLFTWNAFRIECDPQSALQTIRTFDLRSGSVRDGGSYQDIDASGPINLRQTSSDTGGMRFVGEAPVDSDRIRREQAEADVAVGQMMGKPVSLDDALRARSSETIVGTVLISIDVDPAGLVTARVKTIKLRISAKNGVAKERMSTQTVKRRIIYKSTLP